MKADYYIEIRDRVLRHRASLGCTTWQVYCYRYPQAYKSYLEAQEKLRG